jgi:hypothetical protein
MEASALLQGPVRLSALLDLQVTPAYWRRARTLAYSPRSYRATSHACAAQATRDMSETSEMKYVSG